VIVKILRKCVNTNLMKTENTPENTPETNKPSFMDEVQLENSITALYLEGGIAHKIVDYGIINTLFEGEEFQDDEAQKEQRPKGLIRIIGLLEQTKYSMDPNALVDAIQAITGISENQISMPGDTPGGHDWFDRAGTPVAWVYKIEPVK